jgi:hypothetical protein
MTQGLRALTRTGRAVVMAMAVPMLLAACGGGGDDTPPAPTTYNLDAAMTNAMAKTVQMNGLTAQAMGVTYTLSLTTTPSADALFEGAPRKTSLQTVTVSAAGITETTTGTLYYGTGPYVEVGSISDDGSYSVSVSTGNLPTAATVGSSGPLSNDTLYNDSSKATVGATMVTTWSLEADTDTTAFACTKAVMQEVSPSMTSSQTVCFRINTANEVLAGGRVTVTADGLTLEFR